MSISKVKQIRLETTAEYQPISDLNVRFFNQDINTSVLDFIVTRNNDPIPLGVDNIEATIVLTSNKFKISDEVKIKDGLNGILTYTLPDDILERPGKVTGQIYIGIKGKEDTVVQRLFSFNIEDSLINSFDAETKLVYIRKFDQLEEQISQRVESIEQAIANSEDYVTKVIEEKDIALSQIDERKLSVLEEITTLINAEKTNLQTIGEDYKTQFEQADEELNQKIADIKAEINPSTYVTQTQSEKWQKFNFTNSDGTVISLPDGSDMSKLDVGMYEGSGFKNDPLNDLGFYEVLVTKSKNSRKVIYATHSYQNRMFIKTFHSGGAERNWRELTNATEDTGWLDVMLKNNVTSINPVNYKIVTMNNTKQLSIKGSISNAIAGSEVNFGKIPNIETQGTPYLLNAYPKSIKMWIENDGEMKISTPIDWEQTETIDFSATLLL
ncbi:BppU family phage baseplate upper protein [Staphylococcus gallinarum]|uniref:BppU family phage baseplate upper protein n=1 Tax=Staphylococcus gallinarum TaxID=1293 RepID=UPI001E581034|nr:BppU family phage baseplate upper protein [Staphylococcus gallinarum]MCD8872136.1 BppU family phage baseplate upper protein [Staphylococcus gallinarum]